MTRRLIGWLLLFAVFASALLWEHSAEQPVGEQLISVDAPERNPCPYPVSEGDPCDDGCLCPCSPTHTPASLMSGLVLRPPSYRSGSLSGYSSDLHPSDILDRIFHPPRLGCSFQAQLSYAARHSPCGPWFVCAPHLGTPQADGERSTCPHRFESADGA
jgi:hypothetical protein